MNCLNCQREILLETPGRKFCNRNCSTQYRNRDIERVVETGRKCKVCGDHFYPENHRYLICSRACHQLIKMERNEKRLERIASKQTLPPTPEKTWKRFAEISEAMAVNLQVAKKQQIPSWDLTVGDYSVLFPTPVMGYRVKTNQ